jgi:hypothetical protein
MAHRNSQPTRERYVSAFVEPALRRALEVSAREHDRSLSAEIRCAIRSYVAANPSDAGLTAQKPASERNGRAA